MNPKTFVDLYDDGLQEEEIENDLLRPLINVKPLSLNTPEYDLNSYCNFHQAIGHSTDICIHLKNEIQDLIDAGRIIDPEN